MKNCTFLLFTLMFFSLNLFAQDMPKISSGSTEHWYYIQFKRGGAVLQDMGNGQELLTKTKVDGERTQLWKVTGSTDSYVFTSKDGNKIYFVPGATDGEDGFFHAGSSDETTFKFLSSTESGFANSWELQRSDDVDGVCMNQFEGAGVNRRLSEYYFGDGGNPVVFLGENDEEDDDLSKLLPRLSSGNDEFWYYIQFKFGGAVLQDMGNGQNLKTKSMSDGSAAQLWKVTGTKDNYVIESKNGNKINFADKFTSSNTGNVTFTFLLSGHPTVTEALELKRNGATYPMNQDGGSGPEKDLAEYYYGDQGNILVFVPEDAAAALYPQTSDGSDENWYYIQFKKGDAVLQDMGEGEKLMTQSMSDGSNDQLWKVTGSKDNFVIEGKSKRKIAFSSDRFITTNADNVLFKFLLTTNSTYSPALELQRSGVSSCMNQFSGSGPGKELGEYNFGDNNNPLLFVKYTGGGTGLNDIARNREKVRFTLQDRCLRIEGAGVQKATILSLHGQKIASRNNNFTFYFSSPGIYLVTVLYGDHTVRSEKILVR